MKEQDWLMRITTVLAAFCAFILADIYKDFKEVRENVVKHNYEIDNLAEDLNNLKVVYDLNMSNRTYVKAKIK